MGKFTDSQPIPAMPFGIPPLSAGDNDGDENASIQSQAWNDDDRVGTVIPLVSRVEGDEYGDDA